jgi:hypothetical protein
VERASIHLADTDEVIVAAMPLSNQQFSGLCRLRKVRTTGGAVASGLMSREAATGQRDGERDGERELSANFWVPDLPSINFTRGIANDHNAQ